MTEQKWTEHDQRNLVAASEALELALFTVRRLQSFAPDTRNPDVLLLEAARTLSACVVTHNDLVDRAHRIKNPVRVFDPFNDRPVDLPAEPKDD